MRQNRKRALSLVTMVGAMVAVPLALALAQTTRSIWDGVYSTAQADRGHLLYAQRCAMCHGPALEGNGEAPPLTGEFMADWGGTTLADLDDKIATTMPLNAPGTLSPAAAADILAYLLQQNALPAGTSDLAPASEGLAAISFDVTKPKPPPAPPSKRKR